MSRNFKILFAAILIASVFTRDKICEHLGFGPAPHPEEVVAVEHNKKAPAPEKVAENDDKEKRKDKEEAKGKKKGKGDYFVNDSIYRWDPYLMDWATVKKTSDFQAQLVNHTTAPSQSSSKAVEIDWKILMDIEYKLRYFEDIDMEIYAPLFSKAAKELHEKEVIIEGYVIPLDEEDNLLALSFNPYAACFFCGKASPASVISLYPKNKKKRYKVDDFIKFKGTLYLNNDNPNEFYYILRDAKEK